MGFSFGHIALLLIIVLIVFGAGRLPQVMGDIGRGLRSFKDGLKEGEQGVSEGLFLRDPSQEESTPGNDNARNNTNLQA
jgi:sec-independent protein translocase protein TatA